MASSSAPLVLNHEVIITFKKDRRNGNKSQMASLALFRGWFSDLGWNQTLIMDVAPMPASIDDLTKAVFGLLTGGKINGLVRLGICKYVDTDGQFRYRKYIDFNIDDIMRYGGDALRQLSTVIYLMVRAYDTTGELSLTKDDIPEEYLAQLPQEVLKQLT